MRMSSSEAQPPRALALRATPIHPIPRLRLVMMLPSSAAFARARQPPRQPEGLKLETIPVLSDFGRRLAPPFGEGMLDLPLVRCDLAALCWRELKRSRQKDP